VSQIVVDDLSRVTGGAGALGFAASKALLEHGLSSLMIFDLNPAQAEDKINELQKGMRWCEAQCLFLAVP
jgi:NAD(P)-dependent dehydrogenase (short-subunit alcohol dehydrogenase family)